MLEKWNGELDGGTLWRESKQANELPKAGWS